LPERRASDKPIAMACLGLVTFLPDPLRSLPRLNSCISFSTFLPADGEYFRPEEDFFDEDLRLELLDFLPDELFFVLLLLRAVDFFAADLRALLFFALVFLLADDFFAVLFFAEDFFALLDFFFVAFFVAITILPRTQMFPSFETVVWHAGNPARNVAAWAKRNAGFDLDRVKPAFSNPHSIAQQKSCYSR
jgi:hypothetical protein